MVIISAYYGYEWVNSTDWSACHINSGVDQKCGLDQIGYQVEFLQECETTHGSCDYQPYQVQHCTLFCPGLLFTIATLHFVLSRFVIYNSFIFYTT